jgi:hypothetical protein
MSFDRQIDQVCPHEVAEEALFVSGDRMTVRPLRPISSAASVKVCLNQEIPVPASGVYLPAKATGVRRGPFSVSASNNVLELTVDQAELQRIQIPLVHRMAAPQMAALLNGMVTGVVFSVVNDRLVFQSRSVGPEVSIFLHDTSTAAALFGFTANHEYRGQLSVPGWTLVSAVGTLPDRPMRVLVFDQPLRGGSDFVELSYSTVSQECRRCGGTGYEHDWRYDPNGKIVEVRDEALLIQELQKNFYTLRGSNPFHLWYGTGILDAVGKKLSSGGFAQNFIVADIQQAFQRWQKIKTQQEEKIQQAVSDREYPLRLLSVNLEQSNQDPTVMFVSCVVQNRSSEPIQLTRGIRVSGSMQIGGGTIRQSLSSTVLTD